MNEITTNLIPVGTKRRSGKLIENVTFFVDHDTGNPNSTSKGNVNYYINSANDQSASAHVFIDDVDIIMCIPCLEVPEKAWHVLYNVKTDNSLYGNDANDEAIGLELCYFPNDKERSQKAYNNYIEFAAYLAMYHNVNPMKRSGHFELDPTRKTDPENALQYIDKTYGDMKTDICNKYKEMIKMAEEKEQNKVSDWAREAWDNATSNGINDGEGAQNNVTEEQLMVFFDRLEDYLVTKYNLNK